MHLVITYWLDTHVDPGFLLVSKGTKLTEEAFRELLVCSRHPEIALLQRMNVRHGGTHRAFWGAEEQGWSVFPRESGGFWEGCHGNYMHPQAKG